MDPAPTNFVLARRFWGLRGFSGRGSETLGITIGVGFQRTIERKGRDGATRGLYVRKASSVRLPCYLCAPANFLFTNDFSEFHAVHQRTAKLTLDAKVGPSHHVPEGRSGPTMPRSGRSRTRFYTVSRPSRRSRGRGTTLGSSRPRQCRRVFRESDGASPRRSRC